MEPKSAAEELPGLYRAVLDRVAALELSGRREVANEVRSEATRIYSRAWDERARRGLTLLLRRNTDVLLVRERPGKRLRRRILRTI